MIKMNIDNIMETGAIIFLIVVSIMCIIAVFYILNDLPACEPGTGNGMPFLPYPFIP